MRRQRFLFSGKSFTGGVETHQLDNVPVRIYSPEKTLADCFKFRNKIGLDTVIEALRLYRERRIVKVDDLMHFATICRVAKVRPSSDDGTESKKHRNALLKAKADSVPQKTGVVLGTPNNINGLQGKMRLKLT